MAHYHGQTMLFNKLQQENKKLKETISQYQEREIKMQQRIQELESQIKQFQVEALKTAPLQQLKKQNPESQIDQMQIETLQTKPIQQLKNLNPDQLIKQQTQALETIQMQNIKIQKLESKIKQQTEAFETAPIKQLKPIIEQSQEIEEMYEQLKKLEENFQGIMFYIELEKVKYFIVDKIGYGGQGKVYCAYDQNLKKYAVKQANRFSDETQKKKGEYECEVLTDLCYHPNIVDIIAFGYYNQRLYQVLEFLPKDISTYINDRKKEGGYQKVNTFYGLQVVPPDIKIQQQWLKMILQICEAIDYSHRVYHYAHRDLKPQNILIDDQYNIRVCDFGTAKYKLQNMTLSTVTGTKCYMPPENFLWAATGRKLKHVRKADSWAIGCIIYELFTGDQCFKSEAEVSAIQWNTRFNEVKRLSVSQIHSAIKQIYNIPDQDIIMFQDYIREMKNKSDEVCYDQAIKINVIKSKQLQKEHDENQKMEDPVPIEECEIEEIIKNVRESKTAIGLYLNRYAKNENEVVIDINPTIINRILPALKEKCKTDKISDVALICTGTTLSEITASKIVETCIQNKNLKGLFLCFEKTDVNINPFLTLIRLLPQASDKFKYLQLNHKSLAPADIHGVIIEILTKECGWDHIKIIKNTDTALSVENIIDFK